MRSTSSSQNYGIIISIESDKDALIESCRHITFNNQGRKKESWNIYTGIYTRTYVEYMDLYGLNWVPIELDSPLRPYVVRMYYVFADEKFKEIE